jgi:RNA polymerase sigma-70 factor (ECF subfamily)
MGHAGWGGLHIEESLVTDSNADQNESLSQTSESLLVRIKAKDPKAWQRFVSLYGPLIFRWCRRAGLQEADAADVGQDVFRVVAGSIDNFVHGRDGGTFRGWLWTVTRSRILDFLRRHQRGVHGVGGSDAQMKLMEYADAGLDSDDPTDETDKHQFVRRALDLILENCKEETRQAFLRTVIEGHLAADVARDLGISVNAVYLAKSHILRRIRDELAEMAEL